MSDKIQFERSDQRALDILGLEPAWSGDESSAIAVMGLGEVYQAAEMSLTALQPEHTPEDGMFAAEAMRRCLQEVEDINDRVEAQRGVTPGPFAFRAGVLLVTGAPGERKDELMRRCRVYAGATSPYMESVSPEKFALLHELIDGIDAIGGVPASPEHPTSDQEAADSEGEHLAHVYHLAENRRRFPIKVG